MKAREFVRKFVIPAGGELLRKDGDHHIYRLPNGRTFVVPMGGSQTEASAFLAPKLRRRLREERKRP
jgi:predicted RNA binding protein YcfA (HicA-like mRNA interferase family)